VNYWKVILATVVIFGAGVLTGGLLVQNVDHSRFRFHERPQTSADTQSQTTNRADATHPPERGPRPPEMFSRQFVQQLDDGLHLTSDQRDKITKIIADGQERNREIWTNYTPKTHQVMQDVQQRIRAELTPDQLKQFENMMKPHPPRRPPPGSRPNFPAPTNLPPLTPTNDPAGLMAPPLTVSNLSPEALAIFMKEYSNMPPGVQANLIKAYSNMSPEVQAFMIEVERLKAEQGTNPPSKILPPPEISAPPAPAN
jgi:hypothetical protein